jgi:hypothetical protein
MFLIQQPKFHAPAHQAEKPARIAIRAGHAIKPPS